MKQVRMRMLEKTELWKRWERNAGERKKMDKSMKRIKERKTEGEGLTHEMFPVKFQWTFYTCGRNRLKEFLISCYENLPDIDLPTTLVLISAHGVIFHLESF
jgi:hypothetical protein